MVFLFGASNHPDTPIWRPLSTLTQARELFSLVHYIGDEEGHGTHLLSIVSYTSPLTKNKRYIVRYIRCIYRRLKQIVTSCAFMAEQQIMRPIFQTVLSTFLDDQISLYLETLLCCDHLGITFFVRHCL